jgi:hypothetical protein
MKQLKEKNAFYVTNDFSTRKIINVFENGVLIETGHASLMGKIWTV